MHAELILFWGSVLLLVYAHFGYPVVLWLWAKLRPWPVTAGRFEPSVTVIIVAHNEAERIRGRLENTLALDYPGARLEILLASDGSTDRTVEIARAYEPAGVKVIGFRERRGKPAVLNDLIPKAQGDIVVLADARQRFEPGALRALVAFFGDPLVGAVSGELILTPNQEPTAVGEGIGFYWSYEKFIRRHESFIDSSVGVTGAIYAIRRVLFAPLPEDTILDDVLIPMRIARQGYRVLFESGARAYDQAPVTPREEFTRKVRTMAGKFQLLAREPWLLDPLRNRLWLQTVSHTHMRALAPLFLLGAFGTNLFLLDATFYRWVLVGQIGFYAAALAGWLLQGAKRKIFLLGFCYTMCLITSATVVGFFRFISGRQSVTWEKASGGVAEVRAGTNTKRKLWRRNASFMS